MFDRSLWHGVRLEPGRGPDMEIIYQSGLPAPEFRSQEVPEQVVVPIPLTLAVERNHQQVPGLHLFEDSRGSLRIQDRVTQGSAHAVQDRRSGEEPRFRAGDPVKEFRTQVIAHIDVVAGEREADIAVPGAGLDGQRSDVQPGRPSFCPLQKIAKAGLIGLDSRSLQQ